MFNIDDLAKNSFSLDFSKIVLTNKLGKIYTGPGNIFQNSEGKLELKMYTYDEEGHKLFGGRNNSKLGKIIPASHYYSFKAYDTFDQEWSSNRINFRYELSANFKDLIIRAQIYYLSRILKTGKKFNKSQIVIRFKKNIKFPLAPYFDYKAKSHEKYNSFFRVSIIANFIHKNYEFLFYETNYWYVAEIFPLKGRINEKLISYLCESLQFILSANIYWVVVEKFEGNTDKIQIREVRNPTPSRIPNPINLHTSKVSDIWELFKKYFDFVYEKNLSDYHTISSKLHNLIQSSNGSLESQALSVTTLVENIMLQEFSKYLKPSNKFEKDISSLANYLNENDYPNEFRNRIMGFLSNLNKPSVKDIFNHLIKCQVLNKSDLVAWNKLRNPIVHGERINFSEYQKYLTLCYKCQKIFNILIFILIGYKGIYNDCGSYGFPIRKFRKSINSLINKC